MTARMSGTEGRRLRILRTRANRAQGGLCYWCKQPMIETTEPVFRQLTGDHLIPIHNGGRTIPGNIVAACRQCNEGRHPEMNRGPGGLVASAGDAASHSPFACLSSVPESRP